MVKEKRILSYFIGWLVLGFIICFIGIKNTYAATNITYENIGYLNEVTILYSLSDDPPYPLEIPRGGEYQLYNVERIIVQIDNYTFSGGTTYNLELSLPISTLSNNMYSVIDENGNKCSIGTTDVSNSSYPNYTFNCSKNTNSLTLNIYNTDGSDVLDAGIFRWNYIFLKKQLTTTDTSILENQQSQMIEQNQQIIQGQDEIKDTIKDELNSCRPSVNLLEFQGFYEDTNNNIISKINTDGSLNISGTPNQQWANLAYNRGLILEPGTYTFSTKDYKNIDIALRLYNNDNSYKNYTIWPGKKSITFTLEEPAIWYYVYVSGLDTTKNYNLNLYLQLQKGSTATTWEKSGKICSNKIDETNGKLDGIQGALTDSSAPNTSGLENSAGWLPAGPLDSILNLPLTMLNSLTNSLNKTCSPLKLTLPYVNKQIQIPCLSEIFAKITGVNGLWTWVGTIASVLILYNYLLNLYAWVDRVLTLRAEFDEAMGADLANWGRL